MDNIVRPEETMNGVVLGVVIIFACIVGIWGATCLISGVMNDSIIGVIEGFVTAITGY